MEPATPPPRTGAAVASNSSDASERRRHACSRFCPASLLRERLVVSLADQRMRQKFKLRTAFSPEYWGRNRLRMSRVEAPTGEPLCAPSKASKGLGLP